VLVTEGWHLHQAPQTGMQKQKKKKYYTFQRQFDEKSGIILGCPGNRHAAMTRDCCKASIHKMYA